MNRGDSRSFLVVNVRYADSASPIPNAEVRIDENIVYRTGNDGKVSGVALNIGKHRAVISADGFMEAVIEDIPIVANRTTVQSVNLFPLINI